MGNARTRHRELPVGHRCDMTDRVNSIEVAQTAA
jgi:hypothetical protein